MDSEVDALAATLAKPKHSPEPSNPRWRKHPGRGLQRGHRCLAGAGRKGVLRAGREISGEAAGKRLTSEGAKKVVCVIQDQGNVALESRRAGVKAGLGGAVENLNVNGTDMPSVQSTIAAKLQQDPSIDYIVTLGAPIAMAAVQAAATAGSEARIGTFDTNAELVDAIKSGDVQWAVDQQPFLQGYLAVARRGCI